MQITILQIWGLKGPVSRDFALGFFHESPSPKPLKITLGSFRIFSKIHEDICKSRCTTGVTIATGVNDTGGKIYAGINDTGGEFATGINDTGGKFCHQFPLVSMTPVAICHRYQRHRRQIMGTVSGFRHLKVNL
jgi:hypothetical protein